MPKQKPLRKGPWTPKEFTTMWKLKNAGKTNREISLVVHRSISAISHQVRMSWDYMRK